ncbi:MAG: alpha/beta hydrolase [Deltaproteobacteria bacterium]|nr:alpha/beta hydrolase [Deltaproteobacteria bacterium]
MSDPHPPSEKEKPKMILSLTTAYPDYLYQLTSLLCSPVYHGREVQRGTGQPVLLIPGFFTGDWMMTLMAGWLNRLGYQAYFSGIHWNVDCPNFTSELLGWRINQIAQETGHPLTVVGHSLGGMLARSLSINFPEHVSHAVAIGSPVDGTLRVNPLVPFTFRVLQTVRSRRKTTSPSCGSHKCSCQFAQTVTSSLPEGRKFTSIFSKQDEVVHWRACIDPQATNLEVPGRHISLVVNAAVYRLLAELLAAPVPEMRKVRRRPSRRSGENSWQPSTV